MAYATPATVREALAPEGDTAGTAASLSDSQLNDAITEATSEIDSTIQGAPFTGTVPAVVSSIARDVAAYLASLAYRKGVELPSDHPVALRYARAEMLLGKAAKGQLDLSGESESLSLEVGVANPYEGDLFTLEDFGIGVDERFLPPWMGGGVGWP
jgi:phage gp36-like protein